MATRKGKKQKPMILGGAPPDRKVPHKARPFPEIIDESDWEVREGRYPSYIKRSEAADQPHIMQVPLGETAIDRKIRLHEQAHVTFTPPISENDPRLDYLHEIDTLNATEDARIIELMGRANEEWAELNQSEMGLLTPGMQSAFQDGFARLAEHLKGKEKEEEAKAAKGSKIIKAPVKPTMNLLEASRLIASTQGYAEGKIFESMAAGVGLDWVTKDVKEMHKHFITDVRDEKGELRSPTFEDSIEYAHKLEEHFLGIQDQIEQENEAMAESGMKEFWERYGHELDPKSSKPVYTPPTKTKKRDGSWSERQPEGFGTKPKRTPGSGQWGELTIVKQPLVSKLAAREARKVRPVEKGAVPRYMHRLLTDQRVFGRRRKKKAFQGTVLIDCSGSMSLTVEDVDAILRRWPAVTVATYAGDGGKGELWIIAEKGKRADKNHIKPPWGGNVVDGPCLDWLAKQRTPRVWISDGGVTGVGDGSAFDFVKDAALKMKKGKIKRLGNAQELLTGGGSEEYYNYAERI